MIIRLGDKGQQVKDIQTLLGIKADGIFGTMTEEAVVAFQVEHKLIIDGKVGPQTLATLQANTGSKIPQWIEAIKIREGAKSSRNNPGNIRYRGQKYAVNDNGYCKFDTYVHGYEALKTLLVNACTGKSNYYDPDMTLYEFYAGVYNPAHPGDPKYKKYPGYAPAEDKNDPKSYAEFVAYRMNVLPTIQIKNLL